jgi:hypothetical protein
MLLPQAVAGYRVGWFPGVGQVFAEGHPAGRGDLADVAALPAALDALVGELANVGIRLPPGRALRAPLRGREPRPGFGGIRRLDAAADLRFSDGEQGLAVLDVLAQISPPRCAHGVYYSVDGRAETVVLRGYGGRRMLGRVYDKGLEAGTAPRGELIRLEDQRRFQSGRRPTADLGPATVHQLFAKRFEYTARAPMVTLATLHELRDRLVELVADGTVTPRRAERVAGFLTMETLGHPVGRSRSTLSRRRAEARELGLVLARLPTKRHDVDLAGLFEPALGAGAWAKIEATVAAEVA